MAPTRDMRRETDASSSRSTLLAPSGASGRHTQEDPFDESLHALPHWFAWFQKTFGLSFLVLASAYLLGKLATLGWVADINTPARWGVFDGAGVVIFFLAGVAVAGIGLTCSVVFVAAIKRRSGFIAIVTGIGMLLFFGVEVWASLSERSGNLRPTPADLAVLTALGFHGLPPIGPTVIVVSVLFPLGSLYFGFVQQRRAAVTSQDLWEDRMEMERKIRQAEDEARLAEAMATKRAAQARGAIGVVRAGMQAARTPVSVRSGSHSGDPASHANGAAFDADDDLGEIGLEEDVRDLSRDPSEADDADLADLGTVEVYVPDGRLNGHIDTTQSHGGDGGPFR
jgi:hypothetical protein